MKKKKIEELKLDQLNKFALGGSYSVHFTVVTIFSVNFAMSVL